MQLISNLGNTLSHPRAGRWAGLLVASLMLLGLGSQAQAAPLNLLKLYPDVFSSGINVTYNAGSDAFTATGTASTYEDDGVGPAVAITAGTFSLGATIDASGALSTGTLSIGGTIASIGANSGTLLTGTLTTLGFPTSGSGDPLEFLFDVTGGDLASAYGTSGGIILTQSGFSGGFAADFANGSFVGLADTFVVPVPAAVWLFGSGLLGLTGIARRRSIS
jgi:hypothetical protein